MCLECHASCLTCAEAAACATCAAGLVLRQGRCVQCSTCESCPSLFGFDSSSLACLACPLNCLTCADQRCLGCKSGFTLLTGKCVVTPATCRPGTYRNQGACLACPANCFICDGDECATCQASYYLHRAACVPRCPLGYYGDLSLLACKVCHESCGTCFEGSASGCSSCPEGSELQGSTCVLECQDCQPCILGSYLDPATNHCASCQSPHCEYCSAPAHCSQCELGYLITASRGCSPLTCPQGSAKIAGSCVSCS